MSSDRQRLVTFPLIEIFLFFLVYSGDLWELSSGENKWFRSTNWSKLKLTSVLLAFITSTPEGYYKLAEAFLFFHPNAVINNVL